MDQLILHCPVGFNKKGSLGGFYATLGCFCLQWFLEEFFPACN